MKLGITMLIHNKDDIEFVSEFSCFLGHSVLFSTCVKLSALNKKTHIFVIFNGLRFSFNVFHTVFKSLFSSYKFYNLISEACLLGFPFFRKKISILEMEWSGNLLRKPEFRDNSGINGNRKFSGLRHLNRKKFRFTECKP